VKNTEKDLITFFYIFFIMFHFHRQYRQYNTFTQQDITHIILTCFPIRIYRYIYLCIELIQISEIISYEMVRAPNNFIAD